MHARKPMLYTVPEQGSNTAPKLRGGRCICGYVFFPMQTYGCEKCGRTGAALTPVLLAGSGKLVASARVRMHPSKDREAPFMVVSVELDDGPVVRTLLTQDSGEQLPVDQVMKACIVEDSQSNVGDPVVDLRFAPAS